MTSCGNALPRFLRGERNVLPDAEASNGGARSWLMAFPQSFGLAEEQMGNRGDASPHTGGCT
jgi:hypothetical protein